MIKCDEAMKRSKEKCFTPYGTRWRCTDNCRECICAMFKQEDGTWMHKKIDKHKGIYIPVGERNEQIQSI